MVEQFGDKFTKYEVARILGARSLQLAMDAPILLKLTSDEERDLNYDTLRIAEKELEAGVLPITVRRPLPKKSEKVVKKLSTEEIKEKLEKKKDDKDLDREAKIEEREEKEIEEEGEIMEMSQPDDESLDEDESEDNEIV